MCHTQMNIYTVRKFRMKSMTLILSLELIELHYVLQIHRAVIKLKILIEKGAIIELQFFFKAIIIVI